MLYMCVSHQDVRCYPTSPPFFEKIHIFSINRGTAASHPIDALLSTNVIPSEWSETRNPERLDGWDINIVIPKERSE